MPKVLFSIDISSFVVVVSQGKVMYDLYGNVTICSAHEERAPDCEECLNYFYIHQDYCENSTITHCYERTEVTK
jgi:hypothetical protein